MHLICVCYEIEQNRGSVLKGSYSKSLRLANRRCFVQSDCLTAKRAALHAFRGGCSKLCFTRSTLKRFACSLLFCNRYLIDTIKIQVLATHHTNLTAIDVYQGKEPGGGVTKASGFKLNNVFVADFTQAI